MFSKPGIRVVDRGTAQSVHVRTGALALVGMCFAFPSRNAYLFKNRHSTLVRIAMLWSSLEQMTPASGPGLTVAAMPNCIHTLCLCIASTHT